MYKILLIIAPLVLVACAKPPSKISPAVVSSSEYSHLSCSKLSSLLAVTSEKLAKAEGEQRGTVFTDALSVSLILIPVSTMTGDFEAEIARYKGEKQAIERTIANKPC